MAGIKPTYLDLQARIGITKHNGGYPATDRLICLCHVGARDEVLYVGSGIGVGPAHLARTHGCRVTAVDISPTMLEWTERRARRDGVADLVRAEVADVLALPYGDARFDTVIVESVLAFVEDKARALAECARVTRPDGWVGMNETVWLQEAPTGELAVRANALGTWIPTQAQWQALWQDVPLTDQVHELRTIALGEEARSRIQWIGWRWLLPAWGRALRIALTDPGARAALREQLGYPTGLADLMGYSLSAGRRA